MRGAVRVEGCGLNVEGRSGLSSVDTSVVHPAGKKSHAVLSDGCGMPGVSGEEKVQRPGAPGAIRDFLEKLPGDVPAAVDDGLSPSSGSS